MRGWKVNWYRIVLGCVMATVVVAVAAAADIPRPEYPKPQFQRDMWMNLNGTWDFAFDADGKGLDEHWQTMPDKFDKKIVVPFCVESKLSGIGYTDFIETVWYRRVFRLPKTWDGNRIFLNFGAVDYESRVWVNGTEVGRHYGGATSFSFDITDAVKIGNNEVVVYVFDDVRNGAQPSGKQSSSRTSHGVMYTRTTGIWQTVWLEARPQSYIRSVHIVPDLDGSRFVLTPVFVNSGRKYTFRATLLSEGGTPLADVTSAAVNGVPVSLRIARPHTWSPQDPYLYGLRFELIKGTRVIDTVKSYGGLRKFHIEGNRLYLNNRPIFLRFVLDQGFYPDGIWTAPTDAALKHDIEMSQAAGFNGARLHQKVFEERFHYWADRLGYLTWAEFCDWGDTHSFANPQGVLNLEREWRDAVLRDRNYPSILAWTPLNETSGAAKSHYVPYSRSVRSLYTMTHAIDPTRPLNTTSGYIHVITDIFTVHDYDQNPETFRQRYAGVNPAGGPGVFVRYPEISVPYEGQPYVVDEYGGTFWTKKYTNHPEKAGKGRGSWGYGKTALQVENRIKELTDVLLDQPNISGFTYTQLTDVEQEVNGIYTYDRKPKFDIKRMKTIFGAPAAIENDER